MGKRFEEKYCPWCGLNKWLKDWRTESGKVVADKCKECEDRESHQACNKRKTTPFYKAGAWATPDHTWMNGV